jgi:hypothetical protein
MKSSSKAAGIVQTLGIFMATLAGALSHKQFHPWWLFFLLLAGTPMALLGAAFQRNTLTKKAEYEQSLLPFLTWMSKGMVGFASLLVLIALDNLVRPQHEYRLDLLVRGVALGTVGGVLWLRYRFYEPAGAKLPQ